LLALRERLRLPPEDRPDEPELRVLRLDRPLLELPLLRLELPRPDELPPLRPDPLPPPRLEPPLLRLLEPPLLLLLEPPLLLLLEPLLPRAVRLRLDWLAAEL
jgi:hypothetical protein